MDRRMIICLLIALQGLVVVQGFMPFSHRSNMRSTRYHAAESTATFSSEKPLKVLLIVEPTPFNYVSGYANRFKEMLRYLKQGGDEVEIFTADKDPNPPKTTDEGYPITTARGFEFPLYKHVTLTFDLGIHIDKIIKEFKPDLIHCASPSCVINPTIVYAAHYNIPLLLSYHTDLPRYAQAYCRFPMALEFAYFMMRTYHGRADLTLCTSPQLKDDLNQNAGIRRVDVWQKGINTDIFNPKFKDASMRETLSQSNPDAPLLIYVGRLGDEKKVYRLSKILDQNPGVRLAIIGSGPSENELKTHFKDYPNCNFVGPLFGEDLSRAYASADMFVMPSDSETLGFVVLEALASGIPVVGVAAGGLVDIIQDGKTGWLADNNDTMEDFNAKVKRMIDSPADMRAYGHTGYTWAQDFNWEAATHKLRTRQYRAAIALHRARDENGEHVKDIEEAIMRSI